MNENRKHLQEAVQTTKISSVIEYLEWIQRIEEE